MKKYLLMLMVLAVQPLAWATTCTWTNLAGGSWWVAANWSPNMVPGGGDTAVINMPGTYSVLVTNGSPAVSVLTLMLGGATGAQLVVAKNSTFSPAACQITTGGLLVVSNNSVFSPSACSVDTGGALVLDSSATFSAAAMTLTNQGSIFANNYATLTVSNCMVAAGGVLAVDGYATLSPAKYVVNSGGTLTLSNAWMSGVLTVQSGGVLNFSGVNNAYIYSLTVTNQGTVNWTSGSITIGGTLVYNSGLWLAAGNNASSYGGGSPPVWVNAGTLRKTLGAGTTGIGSFNFLNQPSGVVDVQSGTLAISGGGTNLVGGIFTNAASSKIYLTGGTWTDAGGVFTGAGTNAFTGGTFDLQTNAPPGLLFTSGDVWVTGTNTFQQAGAITNLVIDGASLRGTNSVAGTLTFNVGSIPEKLTIMPMGQLQVGNGSGNRLLYSATIINQGAVVQSGTLSVGGTVVSNGGLWQITGDYGVGYGGGTTPLWTNSGILRKSGGTGFSQVDATFINQPGALVDGQTGRLILNMGAASQYGGTFNATGIIDLTTGTWRDAGGVATGTGTNRFLSGALNLWTNTIPGLLLAGGNVYIAGTNTFQNAGAITNLTLDGATLAVTNTISGLVTVNSGSVTGFVTVLPGAQLVFATTTSKGISGLNLFNQGTVTVTNSDVTVGYTVISNGGTWLLAGNCGLSYNGVGTAIFTNNGVLEKNLGTGLAVCSGVYFYNQTNGLVQVDAGILQLLTLSTNYAGTLRLNGGLLSANGTFAVAGGRLDGSGTFGANVFTGGTVSPGTNGAGLLAFSAGLNLNSNVTLVIDGSSPVPGTMYDQLSVTGAVAISNCVLQITSMPTVPAGTGFTLIANDGVDAVQGVFNGLPENAPITVGAQTFRIHYAGGTGNDVTLVRDGVVLGPLLSLAGVTNGTGYFSGSGAIPLTAFTVRASTNLINWTNIGVVTSGVSGAWSFVDTNAGRYARRFYNTTN